MVDVGDSNAWKVRLVGGHGRVGDPSSCLYSHLIVTCDYRDRVPQSPITAQHQQTVGKVAMNLVRAHLILLVAACGGWPGTSCRHSLPLSLPAAGLTLHLIIGGGR